MHILFCLGSMNKGGAERVIANLSNNFIERYKITIVITSNTCPEYELNKKINLISLDTNNKKENLIKRNIKRILKLRKIIKKEKPDVIVSLLPEPTYRVMLSKLFLKNKVIISVRNDPNAEYNTLIKRILVRLLYSNADGFIFQTADAQKWFSKKIQNKSTIIPNPINENFITHPFEGEREKKIVTVGRLVEQKNQKLLIDAFNKFQKEYQNYKLSIFGEGPLKDSLMKHIDDLGLNNKVFLEGEKKDIKSYIYDAEMFILSSDFEGMPNALMEAMALGIPCISTDCPCGGPKFLINNGINGYLFEVNNKEKLYQLMKKLAENKNIRDKFSKNANMICEKLNPNLIYSKWEEYIIKIYNK